MSEEVLDQTEGQTEEQSGGIDYEAEARKQGWVPQEEYTGDPSKWRDAKAFYEYGQELPAVLKKQNDALRRELEGLKKDVRKAAQYFEKAEERAYKQALADLEARRKEAVNDGDGASFDAIERDLEKLKAQAPDAGPQVTKEQALEAFDAFRESNKWYDRANLASATETEVEARLFADRLTEKWLRLGKDKEMPPEDFFEGIASETRAKFPELSRRQKPASDVAGAQGNGRSAKGGRTYADLPPEARAMCDRFVKNGITTREAYVKNYDWS